MKNILITGGSGLVGIQLTKDLEAKGYAVAHLSRSPSKTQKTFIWDYKKDFIEAEALHWADGIVHLAGQSVAGQRWSSAIKKEIMGSRVRSTRLLKNKIKEFDAKIDYFVSASAIGIYDQYQKDIAKEDSKLGDDFLAEVVKNWEEEIFSESEIPTSAIRISIVLSEKGGAYPKLSLPIKYFVGANLGDGNQMMPWIHLEDLSSIFVYAIENKLIGIYNACAPQRISHKEMNEAIAKSLGRKIILPNIPSFALKLGLGEMSDILLKGCAVSCQKIIASGFQFKYPSLKPALEEIAAKTKS